MRLEFSEDATEAFKQATLIHYISGASIPLLILAGELTAGSDAFEPDGIFGLEGQQQWLALVIVVFIVLLGVSVIFTFTELRILRRLMSLEPRRADLAVLQAITSTQVVRSIQPTFVATYGLILYFITTERLELYIAGGFGILLVAFFRPSRNHWESVFRRASTDYPGVSPSPW